MPCFWSWDIKSAMSLPCLFCLSLIYMYVCVYIYVCMYVCMYDIYIYTHTYIIYYICTHIYTYIASPSLSWDFRRFLKLGKWQPGLGQGHIFRTFPKGKGHWYPPALLFALGEIAQLWTGPCFWRGRWGNF